MTKVTISSNGEITIPAQITDQLKLKAGEVVSIDVRGDVLILHLPRPDHDIRDWRTMQGMFKGGESLTKALEKDHRDELAREDARLR